VTIKKSEGWSADITGKTGKGISARKVNGPEQNLEKGEKQPYYSKNKKKTPEGEKRRKWLVGVRTRRGKNQ